MPRCRRARIVSSSFHPFRAAALAMTVLLLAPAERLAAGPPPPPPPDITPGDDCWSSPPGGTRFCCQQAPIPAGFFGLGSLPYTGEIVFRGMGGTHDTKMRRIGPMTFNNQGEAETPLELEELNLTSTEPIVVTYSDGSGGQWTADWDVDVRLSTVPVPDGGMLHAVKTSEDGGTFTAEFFVQPIFTFTNTRTREVVELDLLEWGGEPILFRTMDEVPWIHREPPGQSYFQCCGGPCDSLFIPGVPPPPPPPPGGGGCDGAAARSAPCCVETSHSAGPNYPDGHLHVTTPPGCQTCEPGACCHAADGFCEIAEPDGITPAEDVCAFELGGEFKGNGTSCFDTDGDGIADVIEADGSCSTRDGCNTATSPFTIDTDGDGCDDYREFYEDGTNPTDPCDRLEICAAPTKDCNANLIYDDCELLTGMAFDCNSNGVLDECDIFAGTSVDQNQNGVPDECDDCIPPGAPMLLSPTNGLTGVPRSPAPLLQWTAVEEAAYYLVYFQEPGQEPIYERVYAPQTSYQIDRVLGEFVECRWNVKAALGPPCEGVGTWAASDFTFTTNDQCVDVPPTAPHAPIPAAGAVLPWDTDTFIWQGDAELYHVFFGSNGAPPTYRATVDSEVWHHSLGPNSTYLWQIQAVKHACTNGEPDLTIDGPVWWFLTNDECTPYPPGEPYHPRPPDGTNPLRGGEQWLVWDAENADEYLVRFGRYDPGAGVDEIIDQYPTQPDNSWLLPDRPPSTQYGWQILALGDCCGVPCDPVWSDIWTFISCPADPLNAAVDPDPVHLQDNVALDKMPQWTGDAFYTRFTLFFDNDNGHIFHSDVDVSDLGFVTENMKRFEWDSQISAPWYAASQYRWWIETRKVDHCGGETPSARSEEWIFTTTSECTPTPPAAPQCVSPEDGATNVPRNTRVEWSGEADLFDLCYAAVGEPFECIYDISGQIHESYVPSYDAFTTYEWYVVAKDTCTGDAPFAETVGPTCSFTTGEDCIHPDPPRPVNRRPAHGESGVPAGDLWLGWDISGDEIAERFDIYMGLSTDAMTLITPPEGLTGDQRDFQVSVVVDTTYFWRVESRTYNPCVEAWQFSEHSENWQFSTCALLGTGVPQNPDPIDGALGVPPDPAPVLSWDDDPNATGWRMEFGPRGHMQTLGTIDAECSGGRCSWTAPGVLPIETAFEWRVSVHTLDGCGNHVLVAGDTWRFDTGGDCNSNGVIDHQDISAGTSLDCQPNGLPDECDLARRISDDINSNGIPDECDCNLPAEPSSPGPADGAVNVPVNTTVTWSGGPGRSADRGGDRDGCLQILSVNDSQFPKIRVTAFVDSQHGRECLLEESDFSLTEDGRLEDLELVRCARQGGGEAIADIVLVFDVTGSMGEEIAAMKAQSTQFATDITTSGIDARFGLVTFEDIAQLDLQLTSNIPSFVAAIDGLQLGDGGDYPEAALDGVMLALNDMQWRPEAQKIFLLITDAPTHYRGDGTTVSQYTMPEVIDAVNAAGGTVFGVSPDFGRRGAVLYDNHGNPVVYRADPDEDDTRILVLETGGIWLDINDANFSQIIDEIVTVVTSLWTIIYTTDNTAHDGTIREVCVTVNDPVEGVCVDCEEYEAPGWCDPKYTVYFGTSDPPTTAICVDVSQPVCDPPGNLLTETVYYWRVVATNLVGSTEGPVWSFTTELVDCNNTGVNDTQDIVAGTSIDCNANGIPDECEVPPFNWADVFIEVSSEFGYSVPPPPEPYSAAQALGPPDVPMYGDQPNAWATLEADEGDQYIVVGLDTPIYATGITVVETWNNGFVIKVELRDELGEFTEIWPLESGDTDDSPQGMIAFFERTWPATDYLVTGARITIDTEHVFFEWEEIDAIQFHGQFSPDCNSNGVPDPCDIASGTSTDVNVSGVPDECETPECTTAHPDCDDGNPCTDDYCTSGFCQNLNNTDPCDDGQFCTAGDVCVEGACVSGAGDPCPEALCDEVNDRCVECLSVNDCVDDGLFCTGPTNCVDGACQTGPPPCAPEYCDEEEDECFGWVQLDLRAPDGQSTAMTVSPSAAFNMVLKATNNTGETVSMDSITAFMLATTAAGGGSAAFAVNNVDWEDDWVDVILNPDFGTLPGQGHPPVNVDDATSFLVFGALRYAAIPPLPPPVVLNDGESVVLATITLTAPPLGPGSNEYTLGFSDSPFQRGTAADDAGGSAATVLPGDALTVTVSGK